MKKEWFTPAELLGIDGLPRSRQGVNKRAREDGWEKRRRRGVQGRGVEYSLSSLPESVQRSLSLQEEASVFIPQPDDMLSVWIRIYQQFSVPEREALIGHILRVGVTSVLHQLGISPVNDDAAENDSHL